MGLVQQPEKMPDNGQGKALHRFSPVPGSSLVVTFSRGPAKDGRDQGCIVPCAGQIEVRCFAEFPRGYPIHGHRLPVDIPVRFRIAQPFAMPVESWWMRRLSGEDVRVIGLILVSCIACRIAEFI